MKFHPLAQAILETLIYADIFDQPLTRRELHRYLHGCRVARAELDAGLQDGLLDGLSISEAEGMYALSDRPDVRQLRRDRERNSEQLWTDAMRYGRIAAGLPFMRMLAVTGALAVHNAGEGADIDYLVVASPGRVWTCRLFFLLLVRLAAARGVALCPNYFLTTETLALEDRSIFTARELAQMVPLSGLDVYRSMRSANAWADELLPNAAGSPFPELQAFGSAFHRRPVEAMLSGRTGDRLESWEMVRKIEKFKGQAGDSGEVRFNAGQVQGHFNRYRAQTMEEFARRVAAGTDLPQ